MRARAVVIAASTVVLLACGSDAANDQPEGSATGGDAPAAAEISAADLEAYERGLQREMEAIRALRAAADTASTSEVRFALMRAQQESSTEGARAAGLDPARYDEIHRTVDQTMRVLDFQGHIDGPTGMDTTRVDEATRQRYRSDAYASLPAGTAEALRARQARLAPVWAEYVRMTAVGG